MKFKPFIYACLLGGAEQFFVSFDAEQSCPEGGCGGGQCCAKFKLGGTNTESCV